MFRKIVAITLAVAFIAMASSGLMMMVIAKPSFSMQMHPVHKVFGLVMVLAVVAHMTLNLQNLLRYLKTRVVTLTAITLVILLALLYSVAVKIAVPEEIAQQLDAIAQKVEQQSEAQFLK